MRTKKGAQINTYPLSYSTTLPSCYLLFIIKTTTQNYLTTVKNYITKYLHLYRENLRIYGQYSYSYESFLIQLGFGIRINMNIYPGIPDLFPHILFERSYNIMDFSGSHIRINYNMKINMFHIA